MTKPPFKAICKICKTKVFHPFWKEKVEHLEKRYLLAKEKEQEAEMMADMMGLEFDTTQTVQKKKKKKGRGGPSKNIRDAEDCFF